MYEVSGSRSFGGGGVFPSTEEIFASLAFAVEAHTYEASPTDTILFDLVGAATPADVYSRHYSPPADCSLAVSVGLAERRLPASRRLPDALVGLRAPRDAVGAVLVWGASDDAVAGSHEVILVLRDGTVIYVRRSFPSPPRCLPSSEVPQMLRAYLRRYLGLSSQVSPSLALSRLAAALLRHTGLTFAQTLAAPSVSETVRSFALDALRASHPLDDPHGWSALFEPLGPALASLAALVPVSSSLEDLHLRAQAAYVALAPTNGDPALAAVRDFVCWADPDLLAFWVESSLPHPDFLSEEVARTFRRLPSECAEILSCYADLAARLEGRRPSPPA